LAWPGNGCGAFKANLPKALSNTHGPDASMIRNFSRKTIVAGHFALCSTIWSKFRGLMFSLRPNVLVFVFHPPQKVSLHMWFVFFPIDVMALDAAKKVVSIKENFLPFCLWKSDMQCTYVIELPKGAVRKSCTVVGDYLQFDA
jgi:uncharacterized membrane protein (UPF0127 family)